MLRRDFVRWAVSVGIAPRFLLGQQTTPAPLPPPAPVPYTLGLNAKTPLPHTQTADAVAKMEQKFFTVVQMATLTRLAEVMLPPLDGRPGAVDAETPQFLDFLIGASPAPRKLVYTGGLGWLNLEAQRRFRKPFAQLDDAQIESIVKPVMQTWMSDHPPTEPHSGFATIALEDIRRATMNSKAWSDSYEGKMRPPVERGLYWTPIEPDMRGLGAVSARLPLHVVDAPKATHTIPSYPR